jgi:hypothetical protein
MERSGLTVNADQAGIDPAADFTIGDMSAQKLEMADLIRTIGMRALIGMLQWRHERRQQENRKQREYDIEQGNVSGEYHNNI